MLSRSYIWYLTIDLYKYDDKRILINAFERDTERERQRQTDKERETDRQKQKERIIWKEIE